jgi:hypothetical protein
MFVRGIVVCNQMQIEVGWRFAINLFEKAQPFDVRVARLGASNQLAATAAFGCWTSWAGKRLCRSCSRQSLAALITGNQLEKEAA